MRLLPTSRNSGSLNHLSLLGAVLLLGALGVVWGSQLRLALRAITHQQRQGEELALSLSSVEARALNRLATSNRTIAGAFVAMNHAHASAPRDSQPSMERLEQLMDTAHASQCADFTVTREVVRKGASAPREKDIQRTLGSINAEGFSRALEGTPCAAPSTARCSRHGGCFIQFRSVEDSAHRLVQPQVYSYVMSPLQDGEEATDSALFMARAGYQPPGGSIGPLCMFAPFWRAMPFDTLGEREEMH